MGSDVEDQYYWQMKANGLPMPTREYTFAKPRRWRFDFAWIDQKLAAEIDGGVYSQGRHTRGKGFENDCEKNNQAVLMGWRVLHFSSGMVRCGEALATTEKILRGNQ